MASTTPTTSPVGNTAFITSSPVSHQSEVGNIAFYVSSPGSNDTDVGNTAFCLSSPVAPNVVSPLPAFPINSLSVKSRNSNFKGTKELHQTFKATLGFEVNFQMHSAVDISTVVISGPDIGIIFACRFAFDQLTITRCDETEEIMGCSEVCLSWDSQPEPDVGKTFGKIAKLNPRPYKITIARNKGTTKITALYYIGNQPNPYKALEAIMSALEKGVGHKDITRGKTVELRRAIPTGSEATLCARAAQLTVARGQKRPADDIVATSEKRLKSTVKIPDADESLKAEIGASIARYYVEIQRHSAEIERLNARVKSLEGYLELP